MLTALMTCDPNISDSFAQFEKKTYLRVALNLTTRRATIGQERRTESFSSVSNGDDTFTLSVPGKVVDASSERPDSQL